MSRLWKVLIAAAALVAAASLAVAWSARRDLEAARREMVAVSQANEFLRKTLGEMTLAMTGKDKEIDRLRREPCAGRQSSPVVPAAANAAE